MAFLDENYLLSSDVARGLYDLVEDLPIVDPHNHADVKAICENRNFTDIWEAEGATDHYVWEVLRKRGVAEAYLTGSEATNEEKWLSLANVFPELVGNPTYEWIHLDLKRRLGIDDLICGANGKKIWDDSQAVLQRPEMRPQQLLKGMKVESMCSTDDPIDSLEYHQALQESPIAGVVRPTFRPDRAMNVFKPDWCEYIGQLEEQAGGTYGSVADLIAALQARHDYFAENGCVASDHGVEVPYGFKVSEEDANAVFKKARQGKDLEPTETIGYMSYMLHAFGEMDAAKGWVFQLHIGAVRDVRNSLLDTIGPDTGGDISNHTTDIVAPVRDFLNRFDDRLNVVLYSLDPNQQCTLAALTRAFGQSVSLGSAWWLNDSPVGMRRQLEYIGSVDVLMNMAGMVSDSRKLLSYGSRNEMFRRVLCDVIGTMVLRGQVPLPLGEQLVKHLSYARPKELFGL
ncbi:MAG: glucuronate isomerase [Lentisphaerae bacterium]|jgi:glucuronate isomerase|nr:glucuronate isomerase [Lentisphaerota bacterium]MBT4821484.1 glucuronate isomerase [Lentisphaerota bacterium]MBT5608893.1 glucuronate isomerase [Lentisphaerota bacterium]MBT7057395.1 glucuronate isomerase [Lentisphaerota bacterium]MBT7842759.1 glucuronate isomerase [Lentisphaerota bacterium]